MKKLMFAAAVVAAGVAMADVTSANVVGYQNITINPGFNMIAFNFQPMDNDKDEISIQDFVQNKGDLVAGMDPGTADQIQVWDGTKFSVYFYRANSTSFPPWTKGPGWVKNGAVGNLTQDTVKRGYGVWFARPTDKDAGVITVSGAVNAASKTHDILAGFNMISSAFPCDFKFNGGAIDWAACGAVAGMDPGTADQIQVWDGTKFSVYFYRANSTSFPPWTKGPGWVKNGAVGNLTTDTIPAGKGFWYARPSDKTAGTLVEKSPIAPAVSE